MPKYNHRFLAKRRAGGLGSSRVTVVGVLEHLPSIADIGVSSSESVSEPWMAANVLYGRWADSDGFGPADFPALELFLT